MTFSMMVFPWVMQEKMTLEEILSDRVLKGLKAAGVEGLELFANWFVTDDSNINDDLIARCIGALRKHGMAVPCVDIICDLVQTNAAELRRQEEILLTGFRVAENLGAPVALVAGHMPKAGIWPEAARKKIANGLGRAQVQAVMSRAKLAIEPFALAPEGMEPVMCKGCDVAEVLIRAGGCAYLVLDSGNSVFVGQRAFEQFRPFVEHRLVHVHIKDWAHTEGEPTPDDVGKWRGCPLGEGIVTNAETASMLLLHGYGGCVSLEPPLGARKGIVDVAKRDMPVLRKWFGQG